VPDVEGHAHEGAGGTRRNGYERVLLMSDVSLAPDYFGQWQVLPCNVSEWQATTRQLSYVAREDVAALVKAAGKNVLDVGCGIGLDYRYYKGGDVEYYGVDVTPKFVEEAHRQGVPCQLGNVLHLPFADGSWDSVYCKDLLIHLPPDKWRDALREMVRVARVQVVTLEDNWEDETVYMLREKSACVNKETGEVTHIRFFHNAYGKTAMITHALRLGVGVKVIHVDLPNPIKSADGVIRTGQITIYTKEGE